MATKNKKVLLTGVSGFAASKLAELLEAYNYSVHGTVRVRSDLYRLQGTIVQLHHMELTDYFSVEKVIAEVKPDMIFHLAAQSYVKSSWDNPIETYNTNVGGTMNILEAVRRLGLKTEILITSTSEVYGVQKGIINEDTICTPVSHYGISKLAQEQIGRLYHNAYGMKVVTTRAFNITGWGRGDVFVDSSFAKQLIEMRKGLRDKVLYHGNLESSRDFVDIHDVVEGYYKAISSQKWGEVFCLGSGKPVKIQKILDILIKLADIGEVKTVIDPARLRPVDTPTMKCDFSKAHKILKWSPKIPLTVSLQGLLDYWDERIK